MSRQGRTAPLDWGDGTYVFALGWGELAELQDVTKAGPMVVLRRLMDGEWLVQDISATIRLGLIGGGMLPVEALKKVRTYVEAYPPVVNLVHAQAVLSTALLGVEEDALKKSDDEPSTEWTTSPMDGIRFSAIIGAGKAIGLTPAEVWKMSVWEFQSAVEGWIAANVPDDGSMSDDEAEAIWAKLEAWEPKGAAQ